MRKSIDRLDHMDRNTNGASLIGNGTRDALADPPGCIGREFESALGIEFINRTEKSDVSLLNEIEKS